MKYLFINSVAGIGSTGKIAAQQCRELMAQGHSCVLAFGRDAANCDGIPTIRIGTELDYKFHGVRTRLLDDHGFGSYRATVEFLKKVRAYDPDVIWMHNVHGYYIHIGLLFDYLRTCGKKIYWTLHDCWSFTGHCAYFDFVGCDRWRTGCRNCPQKGTYPASKGLDGSSRNYLRKKASFAGIPDLTIVTPSRWLADLVKESYLKDYPVEVIYNSINTEVFQPTQGDFREKLGLTDKILLLGVAGVWEARKGMRDFVKLASMLDENYKIVLVGLSEEDRKQIPESILGLPRTNSARELAQIYSAADVYVNPSVEETFGMTTVEALCSGTTAVVYQDTACEEVVNQFGGIAVPRGVEHLMKAICEA